MPLSNERMEERRCKVNKTIMVNLIAECVFFFISSINIVYIEQYFGRNCTESAAKLLMAEATL